VEGGLHIGVTRHKDFPPDVWTVYCPQAGIVDNTALKEKELAKAQAEAVALILSRFEKWQHCLRTLARKF
jgi:hypothetical protein